MTADRAHTQPDVLARELDALRQSFERVLPADNATSYAAKLNLAALDTLYADTRRCLDLRAATPARNTADKQWRAVDDRGTDLYKALAATLIQRLNRAVVETVPAPEVTSHQTQALEMSSRLASPVPVKLFRLIQDRCHDLTGHRPMAWWKADLETRLGHLVRFYQTQLNKVLGSGDPPDIRSLAADLLRMDVLYWLLQDLGMGRIAETLAANMKVTARLTLNGASDAVERFINDPDDFNRFDVAVVLSAVDDLIHVMERVMEDHRADQAKAEDDTFFQGLGMEAITRFVKDMGRLILLMFEDLSVQAARGELTYRQFDLNMAKIERIYDFCRLADPLTEGRVHRAASKVIQARSRTLVKELSTLVERDGGTVVRQSLRRLEQTLKRIETEPKT